MLEALLIMGLTALAGSWLAVSDPMSEDGDAVATDTSDADPSTQELNGDWAGEYTSDWDDGLPDDRAEDDWAGEADISDRDMPDLPEPITVLCPETCLDNFNPDSDVLTIQPPEGFDADEAEVALCYDPHFHETEITVTGPDGDSFSAWVSGVEPEQLGPENMQLAA